MASGGECTFMHLDRSTASDSRVPMAARPVVPSHIQIREDGGVNMLVNGAWKWQHLYTKIAHWRVWRGLTQDELAERTGIPLRTLRDLEAGRVQSGPSLGQLQNLRRALKCDLTDLIDDWWLAWQPFNAATPAIGDLTYEPAWGPGQPVTLDHPAVRQPQPRGRKR